MARNLEARLARFTPRGQERIRRALGKATLGTDPDNVGKIVRAVKRSNRGNVRVYDPKHGWFDSKTERDVFLSLVSTGVDVIRQVRIPVARDEDGKPSCLVVDFLEILEVHADGTFTARLSDAKGWDKKRGTHRVERDWKAKAAALYDKHGIKILKRSE